MIVRTYSELITLQTFEERFNYLKLAGTIGETTFGLDRYLNQTFYNSVQWKSVREYVITRDNACDLGIVGRDILDAIRVHHMNPISVEDIENGTDILLGPEFLICTSINTHNAIHFGNERSLPHLPIKRRKGDTAPWRVY